MSEMSPVTESLPDPSALDVLLKVTKDGGAPFAGRSDFRWSLPTQSEGGAWKPGAWMRVTGQLVPCLNGLHLSRVTDLPRWIVNGTEVYLAEAKGRTIVHEDSKVVARSARLLIRLDYTREVTLRLWAADCAEHVLHLFEQRYPDDDRPRRAITAARAYARGEITRENLFKTRLAASSAAYAAYAAYAADAAYAAYAADAAYAAAAADADDAAAYAAARRQEREWQVRRLATLLGVPGYATEVQP